MNIAPQQVSVFVHYSPLYINNIQAKKVNKSAPAKSAAPGISVSPGPQVSSKLAFR